MNHTPIHEVPQLLLRQANGRRRESMLKTKWLYRVLMAAGWDPTASEGRYIVHDEVTGPAGRVDIALMVESRVVACIEIKSPNVALDEAVVLQALKYASSYYLVAEGKRDPVLAICTNGRDVIIMDPALEDAHLPINSFRLDLTSAKGVARLVSILKRKSLDKKNGSLPIIKTQRQFDTRPFASNVSEKFEKTVFGIVEALLNKGYSTPEATDMTIQCLLLAAARDNGVIPNQAIARYYADGDWNSMQRHFHRLFGDIFSQRDTEKSTQDIWKAYESTRFFNVRLDILPVQFMGIIYERLLTRFFENKTSFFTPEDMIDTVLAHCRPTLNDKVLDPTCGSGAFLAKVASKVTRRISKRSQQDEKDLVRFFSNLHGVDKDPIACKIAKMTLLCTFMRLVGEKYQHSGKPLPRPCIDPPADFFDWQGGKYTLVLGNPPWESIDELDRGRRLNFSRPGAWAVYEDKNDQLCYVIEKSIEKHLVASGRFGFVIKLQSLLADKYGRFCDYLNYRVEKVFDYGRDAKFGNYAQSAGICGRKFGARRWSYEYLHPEQTARVKGNSFGFESIYDATQGAQSAADRVYKTFAAEYPSHPCVLQHPVALNLGGEPGQLVPMAYVWRDKIPHEFVAWVKRKQNGKLKHRLSVRADVKRTGREIFSYSWDNSRSLKGPMLITERNLTPGHDRFHMTIDLKREYLATGGQTCVASLASDAEELFFLGGLLVSSFFVPLCRGYNLIPRRAGGVFFNPKTVKARMRLPHVSLSDRKKIVELIRRSTSRGTPLHALQIRALDSVLRKYVRLSYQKSASEDYGNSLLSSFLQPALLNGVDDADVA